jgi:hypothetical protein
LNSCGRNARVVHSAATVPVSIGQVPVIIVLLPCHQRRAGASFRPMKRLGESDNFWLWMSSSPI